MEQVTIDFVRRTPELFQWRIVLVEEGPWDKTQIKAHLQRIQDRLYVCIDAAIDGDLARQFPDSAGRELVIQLDCYDVPEHDVRDFFERFSREVFKLRDYRSVLTDNEFVSEISFELNCSRSG